jgi:predicted amidohydrolase YtcJ
MNPRNAALCALLLAFASPLQAQEADVIVTNARFWTADERQPWAEAVAIRGDRILAVGSAEAVNRHRTSFTRVIDAGGRMGTPGFIDNHTHFNQAGALLLGINLLDVADEALLRDRVEAAGDRLPEGAWITGGDWGAYEDWEMGGTGAERREEAGKFNPDRSMIDAVSPNTGVFIWRWDRTAFLANTVALEAAGLRCGDPGVECAGGIPTGRVSGEAVDRVRAGVPPRTFEQQLREARVALEHLSALGVTGIHDNTPPTQFPVFQELNRRGELPVRIYARPTLDKWAPLAEVGLQHGFGDEYLKIGGLKGFVDGIMGNSTARFYEPQLHSGSRGFWRDSSNTAATHGHGSGMLPSGNMERLILGADAAGHWPQVHAIGDEAIDTLLTIMERAIAANGPDGRRFRIIHSQVIRDADVPARYARSGIIAEMQPYHAIDDMRWMEERIGERARWAYAFRTFHDAGVMLSFGSDWPGTNASWYPADPLQGIYAAVVRKTLDGQPEGGWYPEERIDLETALRAYTINNAYAAGEEDRKGSLEVGKLADLVLLDHDLFAISPDEIKDVRVVMTMVGGRVVFSAE